MARKVDILAPMTANGGSVLTFSRWLKLIGEGMLPNEPIAELNGSEMVVYVHAPSEGILSSVSVQPGQNVLSGAMLGQISVIAKDSIEWDNFDQVAALLEESADKSNNTKQLKDANEALGQLLGVAEKAIFQKLSIEEQNKFLQNVVDQHKAHGLSPADVAQQLLAGLQLRPPIYAPASSAPAFGVRMAPSGPGGMGGGGGVHYTGVTPQQQQGYAPYNATQVQGQWPAVPQGVQPYNPPLPKEDDK